jgi:hypothetical protein
MNGGEPNFNTTTHTSKLFDNLEVLTMCYVGEMDPRAKLENVPVPDRDVNKAHVYVCHRYDKPFKMDGRFRVFMAIQDRERTYS